MSAGSKLGADQGPGSKLAGPIEFNAGGKNWDYLKSSDKLHFWSITDPLSNYNPISNGFTTLTGQNGQLRAQPHVFSRKGQLTDILIPLNILALVGATPMMRFALYDSTPSTSFPGNRLWDSGDVLADTTNMPGGAGILRFKPGLQILPGFYFLAWTINAGAVTNQISAIQNGGANLSLAHLGAQDKPLTYLPGWTAVATPTSVLRSCFQWCQQVYAYPSGGFDAIYPGSAGTARMSDGAGSLGIVYGGTNQFANGGLPLQIAYKFSPS